MSRLTVRDIAALAGVSTTTVSRVVNGRGEVRPSVREHVQSVIDQHHYRPLASATALASQRTGLMGFVVPLRASTLFEDPYFAVLIRELTRAAATRGVTMALFLLDAEGDESENTLIEQVIAPRRVDAIITSAFHTHERFIDELAGFDVPALTMGDNLYRDRISSVSVDNPSGGELAGAHAASITRGRVAMIGGPADTQSGVDRRIGFVRGLAEAGYTFDDAHFREGDYTRESGETAMRELLAVDPDVVFVASDTMAMGALTALRLAGKRVPEDVAMIGFDDLPFAADLRLTSVRQPIAEVASRSVDILLGQLQDSGPTQHEMLRLELIERESTRRQ